MACKSRKVHQSHHFVRSALKSSFLGFHSEVREDSVQTSHWICAFSSLLPFKTTPMSGCLYFVTFFDDFSRKVRLYVLKSKKEVFVKFVEFKALVEKQWGHKIRAFRLDNGGELTSKALQRFLKAYGIQRQVSIFHISHQNGVAQRPNRTIVEVAKNMLDDQNVNKTLLAEAVI